MRSDNALGPVGGRSEDLNVRGRSLLGTPAVHFRRSGGLFRLERMTGIEPAYSAWEADVLPLNYIRGRRP